MTTYTAFVTALAAMTVTGVTRKYTAPPASLGTADLPASFPMLASGNEVQLVFGNGNVGGGQSNLICDLVFAIEPVGQGTQIQNFTAALTLIDAIVTASKALTRPTAGPCAFNLKIGIVAVAGNDYWAIIESWTGVG